MAWMALAALLPSLVSATAGGGGGGGGGMFGGLASLLKGDVGAQKGDARRKAARAAVAGSALQRIHDAIAASGARTPPEILQLLALYGPQDPEAAQLLLAVVSDMEQRRTETGPHTQRNYLGDVLKWTLLRETVTDRPLPSSAQIVSALRGQVSAQPMHPIFTAQPVGAPVPVNPASFGGTSVGTFLDSIGAIAGQAINQFLPAPAGSMPSPYSLPTMGGGLGGGLLGGLLGSQLMPSLGVPFVDITPQGSSAMFEPFRLTQAGARAQIHVQVNPATGKPEFFGPLGRPILFSRDRAVVRRARKIGSQFGSLTCRKPRRSRRGGR